MRGDAGDCLTLRDPKASVVYFLDWHSRGDLIRIGQSEDWARRKRTHEEEESSVLAVMPAPFDYEQRLHRHFEPHRHGKGGKSVYQASAVFPYVEWLLRSGYAALDEAELAHLPTVPWPTIDPSAPRRDPAPKQLTLVTSVPTTLKDKARRSARYACWSSKTDEWYTPDTVIEAARSAMGGIDLDPASCPAAQRTVRASAYYSEVIDGLDPSRFWGGRVWMNPPYGGKADDFVQRLLSEIKIGSVTQAIVLLSSQAIVTKWSAPAMRAASAIGVSRGRWEFLAGNGQPISSPAGGSSLLYFGDRVTAFAEAFDALAHVMRPCWSRP